MATIREAFTSIADAIRDVAGVSTLYTPSEMPAAISANTGGGSYKLLYRSIWDVRICNAQYVAYSSITHVATINNNSWYIVNLQVNFQVEIGDIPSYPFYIHQLYLSNTTTSALFNTNMTTINATNDSVVLNHTLNISNATYDVNNVQTRLSSLYFMTTQSGTTVGSYVPAEYGSNSSIYGYIKNAQIGYTNGVVHVSGSCFVLFDPSRAVYSIYARTSTIRLSISSPKKSVTYELYGVK